VQLSGPTPVAIVEEVEPSLEFFETRLGFVRDALRAEGGVVRFVALRAPGGASFALRSRADAEDDLGVLTGDARAATCVLCFAVESLAAVVAALAGAEVAVGARRADDGGREILYREPGGHLVAFVERPASSASAGGGSRSRG
jgi:hypothetical protein